MLRVFVLFATENENGHRETSRLTGR
jgi:hypothetical protein